MNHRTALLSLALAAAFASLASAQAPLTLGNLIVVRVGDGSAALTAAAAPIFLDEYTTTGTLVQSIAVPSDASGGNRACTVRGLATSEAYLSVAENGLYAMLTGYDTAPGTTGFDTANATVTNRVIARLDLLGTVDTSTALTDAYSSGNPRAVVSDDGNRFWMSGTSTTQGGIRFVANLGATTSLGLNAGAPTNCRVAGIFDGQLYTTSASTVYLGVCTVGTGLPTTAAQPITLLPGFPTTGSTAAQSAYDFYFADANTLYVADDNSIGSTNGGIQKWTFNGTTWVKQYRLQLAVDTGCRGLTGFTQDGVTTLWGTVNTSATGGAVTQLVTVTDTGPASVVTSLGTSPLNTAFRGLRRLGLPSTISRIPASCGTADIFVGGNGQIGTELRTTIRNAIGIPLVGYGTIPVGVPFCGCTVLHDFGFFTAGATSNLTLPNNSALIGAQLLIQGMDFLAPGGCVDLPFTLTDGYSVTIQ